MARYVKRYCSAAKRESPFRYLSCVEGLVRMNSFISACRRGMQVRISRCLLPIFLSPFVAFFAGGLILGSPRCIERGRRVDLDRWRFAPREPRGKGQPNQNQTKKSWAVPFPTFWLYRTNSCMYLSSYGKAK